MPIVIGITQAKDIVGPDGPAIVPDFVTDSIGDLRVLGELN